MKSLSRSARCASWLVVFIPFVSPAQPAKDSTAARKSAFAAELAREVTKTHYFARIVSDSFAMHGSGAAGKYRPGPLMDSAMHHGDLAMDLADSVVDRKTLGELYEERSRLENIRGDYEQAHNFFTAAWNINDSLNSQQKKNELSELKGKQDLESRNKEIAMNKLQASTQKTAVIVLFFGLFLLGVIGALLYRQNRRRRQISTTLLVLNGRLEEANKVKARFFGILSHDLRSPIANLLSFLHLVKNDPDILTAEEKDEQQQGIGRSAEELLETMEAMLLWSKEQMNSFKPDIRLIPVDDLFGYLQKFFGQEKNIKLVFVNPDNMLVPADENYLRVIMQNLTSNALKALKNNPAGRIEWKAVRNGNQTALSITDNGPGMKKEQAAALYEETNSANARSGFGFHLIRDLAKAISYSISIDSQPGAGTTFTLRYLLAAAGKTPTAAI